jgi:hypothetical protein
MFNAAKRAGRSCSGTVIWSPPSRSGFTATVCVAASSSPTISARCAPLASGYFISD